MSNIYLTYEYWFAAFQLIFAMFGMGATLTIKDFENVVKTPRAVAFGTLIQLALIPLVAYVFIGTTGVTGGIAIGLVLVAAIPGGTTSNIFTFFAKGNVPLSISITAITTLGCLITTPLVLSLMATQYLPADFSMPTAQIIQEIALTLLLPLMVGMAVLRYLPNQASTISRWSIRLSLLGLLAIVVGSSSAGRFDLQAFGSNNLLLVLFFIVLLALISWLAGRVLRLRQPDYTAIEMEVIVRNVNLGVLITASIFPASAANDIGDMMLFTILLYGALQMLAAALLIYIRRGAAK